MMIPGMVSGVPKLPKWLKKTETTEETVLTLERDINEGRQLSEVRQHAPSPDYRIAEAT